MGNIEWNRVTWYSKIVALVMAFFILALGIYIGIQYQQYLDLQSQTANASSFYPVTCQATKQCPTNYSCKLYTNSKSGICVKS